MPLITVQMDNTPLATKKRKHNSKKHLSPCPYIQLLVDDYCMSGKPKERRSLLSTKELPHFREGELMFSAVAEGHSGRPGKAQDVTCRSGTHSDIAVLTTWGRGQKPKQCRKLNAESAGAENRSSFLEVLPQG